MGKLWVTCVRIKMKIDRVITAPHCIVTLCKLVMFHAYDQVAVHVYLYWTQDTIEGISFARDLFGYRKHRFIPTHYVFMFWNRNLVFKFTTIDVPSGLHAKNFQSSVIHHHEFSLFGKFNVYTCIWETLFEKPNWAIWILAGNCLTMVTSISRHDLLPRPHTKNIKSFCNYVTSIDVNQFGSFISYMMIDINHICFCTFIHAIKLMKDKLSVPHEEWPNLGMTDPVCWPLSLSW